MSASELLKKVRRIEIKTKGLSNHIFAGEYHTAFKGKGMAFSEVREYQPGDDVRLIDWNVTARYNTPFVKVFEEEREMTVMLLVDISASGNFGTSKMFKRELATEIAAIIAFSAIKNNDKVGIIFFTDRIENFIPPNSFLTLLGGGLRLKAEGVSINNSPDKPFFDRAMRLHSYKFRVARNYFYSGSKVETSRLPGIIFTPGRR